MRNKLGIGFFGVMIVALMLVTGAYQLSYQRAKENMEVKLKVAKETQTEGSPGEETKAATPDPATVAADGQALKEDCYYLMEVNGYVVVYLSDKKTPYEYTDIKQSFGMRFATENIWRMQNPCMDFWKIILVKKYASYCKSFVDIQGKIV